MSDPIGMLACTQGTNPNYCCDNSTSATCCNGSNVFPFIPGNFLGGLDAQGVLNPPQAPATTITVTATNNAAQSTASSSSQTSSSSSAASEGASSSQSPVAAKSSDSTTGRTVGLAVGIPLGVLLVAAIGGLFWFFNRKLNQEKAERQKLEEKLTNSNVSSGAAFESKHALEKGDGDAGHELPGFGGITPVSGRHEMGPGKSLYNDDLSSSGTRV